MSSQTGSGRFEELDVLRGLAALLVVVFHYAGHCARYFNDFNFDLAAVFRAAGVDTGTPIAFIAPNSDLTVLAFLAAGAIGAVFVPMNAALTDAKLNHVIEHSRVRILCSVLALKSRVEGLAQGLAAMPRHLAPDE